MGLSETKASTIHQQTSNQPKNSQGKKLSRITIMVTIKTLADFESTLSDNERVAVDFTASWCGPCKMIGPKFEAMASDFPSIKFIKVDVDENSETSEKCGIAAMPTFFFYANGEKIHEVVGASEGYLREGLQKLAG